MAEIGPHRIHPKDDASRHRQGGLCTTSPTDWSARNDVVASKVTFSTRTTEGKTDATIPAATLDEAIVRFVNLSQKLQDSALADLQGRAACQTLEHVLGAARSVIKDQLVDALNGAAEFDEVAEVLIDASIIFPEHFAPIAAWDMASVNAFQELFLVAALDRGFADFGAAKRFFHDAIAFVQAGEKLVHAANQKDLEALATQVSIACDTLASMNVNLGDLTVARFSGLIADLADMDPAAFQAAADDLARNAPYGGWAVVSLYDGSLFCVAENLFPFWREVQSVIASARENSGARFTQTALEKTLLTLQSVQEKIPFITIDGRECADAIHALSAMDTSLKTLASGRMRALVSDIAANITRHAGNENCASCLALLEKLIALRQVTQSAVTAGQRNSLGVAEFESLRDALAALDGRVVNSQPIVAREVTAGFNALIRRFGALSRPQFRALQSDLGLYATKITSFSCMFALFNGLLTYRETAHAAAEAGNAGALVLRHIEAVTAALLALPEDVKTHDTGIASFIKTHNHLERLLGAEQFPPDSFAELAGDLAANAGAGFESYAAMLTLLGPLAEFHVTLRAAIHEIEVGDFTRGEGGTLETVLEKLETIAAAKASATIEKIDIGTILAETTEIVERINKIPAGCRFIAFASDLAAESLTASLQDLSEALEHLLVFHETVEKMLEAGKSGKLEVANACILQPLLSVLDSGARTLNRVS